MSKEFDTNLNGCLGMLEGGISVEDCLASFPQLAGKLWPLLETATRLRRLQVPRPSPEALARGEQGLVQAMAREGDRPTPRFSLRPLALASVVAALALIGLALGGPLRGAFDLGSDAAIADGTVTAVGAGSLEIQTDGAVTTIFIDHRTQVEAQDGTRLDLRVITPGVEVRIRGIIRDDGNMLAQRIEVRVEPANAAPSAGIAFQGHVAAVADGTITVATPRRNLTVLIGPETVVRGQIALRVLVEVEGTSQADGAVLASEIEVITSSGAAVGAGADGDGEDVRDEGEGEMEFQGQVVADADGSLTVTTPSGDVNVTVMPDTEVTGSITAGAVIAVEGSQQTDGSVVASEIEVVAKGEGEAGSSGPGSAPAPDIGVGIETEGEIAPGPDVGISIETQGEIGIDTNVGN